MSVQRHSFGTTGDGLPVEQFTLQSGKLAAEVISYGASLRSFTVSLPGKAPLDMVLGYDNLAGYEHNGGCLGAIVGRYANRIANASCIIDGEIVPLEANEGTKQLHGGSRGFHTRVFSGEITGDSAVTLTYTAEDGEGGHPGRLTLRVTYTLTEQGLSLRYQAQCDKTTYCNITNHSYFNLNGSGDAMDQRLWLAAHSFTPVDKDSIPLGMSAPVEGTAFDFTEEKRLRRDIGADSVQLHRTCGYDHNFVLDPAQGLRLAARLNGDLGVGMEVWTEKPGIQVYTANFLKTDGSAKGGVPYAPRQAVCLETQFFPDSPNHPEWGDILLRPGHQYDYTTEFRIVEC